MLAIGELQAELRCTIRFFCSFVNISKNFGDATDWCIENGYQNMWIGYTFDITKIVDTISTCEGTLLLKHNYIA